MRRDYEYIVLGLGGWGSAAAYWLSRRAGADVLGWSSSSWGTCEASRRTTRASSGSPTTRRHTSSWPSTPTGRGPSWSGTPASSSCSRPAGSTSRPRESAIPLTNYSGSMDAAGVAYEHLDAGGDPAPLAAVRGHRRHPRAVPGRRAGSRWPPGGTRPTCAWRARTARRCVTRRRSSGSARRGRRDRGRRGRDGLPLPAAGHRRGRLDQRRADPLRACTCRSASPRSRSPTSPRRTRPSSSRAGSRSGSGWTTPASTASRSFGEAGPKVGQDAGGPGGGRRDPDLRARPGGARAHDGLPRAGTSPRRWARSSTPRPACTPSRRTATS